MRMFVGQDEWVVAQDDGLAPVKNLDLILAKLDRDPTGIYWG